MQALAIYNRVGWPSLQLPVKDAAEELREWGRVVFSERGTFIKYEWPDWPEDFSNSLMQAVGSYLSSHPQYELVTKESDDWLVVFDREPDPQAAARIGEILNRHFPGRVSWVAADRDRRSKVKAISLLEGIGLVDWHLSWRGATADYRHAGLKDEDVQAMNGALFEVSRWAENRIRPILNKLQDKLAAMYGDRFRGLYVFGSYARPDTGIELPVDSDLDIAVLLSEIKDRYREIEAMSEIAYNVSLEHGLSVSLTPLREDEFREGSTSFAKGISAYAKPA